MLRDECVKTFLITFTRGDESLVVASTDFEEFFRLLRRFKQSLSVPEWHHFTTRLDP